MMNVVLVDDDVLALGRLKSLIRMDGVRIAGQFTQPDQALEFILREAVDIVMTDMKMPKLDGVELIRRVKAVKPDVAVICISSYEDFHYVKESFRQGSVDYILKHALDEESVTRALGDAILRVSRERPPAEAPVSEELRAESIRALKTRLLMQLLNGELSADAVLEKLEKYGLKPDFAGSVLLLCEIDDYDNVTARFSEKDKSIFHQAVTDLFERVLARVGEKEILRIEEDRYAVLLSWPQIRSRLYLFNSAHELSRRLNYNMEKMLNATMSIAIGDPCPSPDGLASVYDQCRKLLANKLYTGKGKIHHSMGDGENPPPGAPSGMRPETIDATETAETVIRMLEQGENDYREPVEAPFQRMAGAKLSLPELEPHLVTLLNAGYAVVNRHRLKLPGHLQFHALYPALRNAETLEDMKRTLLLFYDEIARECANRADMAARGYNRLTIETIDWIKQHFHKPVSLQDVADALRVHPTYLSKVFKADTGLTFTEYLNRRRIDRAIELISTGRYSIKQIYREVGFNQYTYFFKVFRQITGVSPSEYET